MGLLRDRLAHRHTGAAAPPAASRGAAPPAAGLRGPADPVILGITIALIAFGVVMVFSGSAVFAQQRFGNGYYFLVRQAAYAAVAVPLMLGLSRLDHRRFRVFSYPALLASTALLVWVALGFGHRVGGAARWITVGPVHVQPAETAKLAMILWLAASLSKKQEAIRTFKVGILPHVLVMVVLSILCLCQPDFGSAVMIVALTVVLLFCAGAKVGPIALVTMGLGALGALLVWTHPYRMRRIEAFLDPFGHRRDAGYQIAESILAFGSGGATGVGIGDSRQKLFFLPEVHTDFISAIVGEELGFVGVALLVLAFTWIVVRGVRIAFAAADDYGAFLAVGVSMFVGLQALTNLGVAMGMLPTKGLVLPFVSYGGSALLVNAAAMGILLSVSRTARTDEEARATNQDGAERGEPSGARASAPAATRPATARGRGVPAASGGAA
jgi:cell division protein FtsW